MKSTSFIRFHLKSKSKFQFYPILLQFTGLVEAGKVWKGGVNPDMQRTEKNLPKVLRKQQNKISINFITSQEYGPKRTTKVYQTIPIRF